MIFPFKYKCLTQNEFEFGDNKIVPIRYEDRLEIMNWRNEQMYHLRQPKPLSEANQDRYYKTEVLLLFSEDQPNQILFSYLENNICIGYGGLVHINWIDKNAEISFVMNTELEKDYFSKHWTIFLYLVELVAFKELNLNKLFTYAFDIRPHLYEIIENSGFVKEATLKKHYFFNGAYKDVIIHSKFNKPDTL